MTLRVDRLDLLRRQLRVEEPIKSPSARRTVALPAFLVEVLDRHLEAYPGAESRVFTAPQGDPFIPRPGDGCNGIRPSMPASPMRPTPPS
jgi:hypothetical protein